MIQISDAEFEMVRDFMFKETGVSLRPTKKPLIISRLRKRVEDLGFTSFAQYMKKVQSGDKEEIEYFINALSTNETFFFRHTKQFNYLYETILPEIVGKGVRHIKIWSGASSTGEEPYSIAITLKEFLKTKPGIDFTVYASDINTEVLQEAKLGQFDERSLKETPPSLQQRYFKQGATPKGIKFYQISDEIRKKVEYFQHNLQQKSTMKDMDIIFLRNVLIYFERATKEHVVNLLEPSLKLKGYFFISLSENLYDIKTSLRFLQSGIYQKD